MARIRNYIEIRDEEFPNLLQYTRQTRVPAREITLPASNFGYRIRLNVKKMI